jgi:hypothetical protein
VSVTYIGGMQGNEGGSAGSRTLDRERGRRDDLQQLRTHLPEAPGDYLEGALDNAALGPEELVLVLRHPASTAAILTRIARNRAWMRPREMKVAFVGHPRAPWVLARRFFPHLYWRDLANVAANLRISPVLRREAERLLRTRLPELSVGEKVSLARRGSRGVLEMLCTEPEPQVLRALAGNPRATEADLGRILARSDLHPEFLGWLATQSSWGQRRAVRLALVRHPATPHAAGLRSIQALSPGDLDDLQHDPIAPRLARVAAQRLLALGEGSAAGERRRVG